MMDKKKWVGYVRVSTDDQTNENQIPQIEKWFEFKGITDYEILQEKESTRKSRPVKNEIYKSAIKGDYEGIVFVAVDRWARSVKELINDMEILTNRNVKIVSLRDLGEINYSDPFSKAFVQFISILAELERSIISKRTREALAKRKQDGVKLGRPKGSRDKKPRAKSGYYLREAEKRKKRKGASK